MHALASADLAVPRYSFGVGHGTFAGWKCRAPPCYVAGARSGRVPSKPNLEKQRKLAKALARDYWRGEREAVARVQALHPKPPSPQRFALSMPSS